MWLLMKATRYLRRFILGHTVYETHRLQLDFSGRMFGGWKRHLALDKLVVNGINVDIVRIKNSSMMVTTTDNRLPSAARWVLYLHGGAYCTGSSISHGGLAYRIAKSAGPNCAVMIPNYRLAPEHPYPAALEDALACYEYLLEHGVSSSSITIAGDSAGGGLSLATLLRIRDTSNKYCSGIAACCVLISPWVDLCLKSDSYRTRAEKDVMLTIEMVKGAAAKYAGSTVLTDPYISPIYADLCGLPPIMIHVSGADVLYDEGLALGKKASEAGVKVQVKVWEDCMHAFQFFALPSESVESVRMIGEFIKEHSSY